MSLSAGAARLKVNIDPSGLPEFDVPHDDGFIVDALQSVSEMLEKKPVEYQAHLLKEIQKRLAQKSHTPSSSMDNDRQALIGYVDEIQQNLMTGGEQKDQLIQKLATIKVIVQFKNRFDAYSEMTAKARLIAVIIEAVQADAAAAELTILNLLAEKAIACLNNSDDDELKKQLQELVWQLVKVQSLAHNTKTLSAACKDLKPDTEHAKKAHIIIELIKKRQQDLVSMQEPLLNILAGIAVLGLMYPVYMGESEKSEFKKKFSELINDQTLEQNMDTLDLVYIYSNPLFHRSLEELLDTIKKEKLGATTNDLSLFNDIVKKTIIGLCYPGQHEDNSKEYDAILRVLIATREPKYKAVAKAAWNFNLVLGAAIILGVAAGGLVLGPWIALGAISAACKLIAGMLVAASAVCSVTACCFFSAKKAADNANYQALQLYNKTHHLDPIIKREEGRLFLQ